jgi:hypothetical protein
VPLDELYEDDDMEAVAEWWMTDAAVQIATGTKRRYEWRGGRVYRDFEDEREAALQELAQTMHKMAIEGNKDAARAAARKRRRSS